MYNQSPLPLFGQKRRMVKYVTSLAKDLKGIDVVVDMFGGSGLLSHCVKSVRPDLRVVYNDFDNFVGRLAAIPLTNKIIAKISQICQSPPLKRLPEGERARILDLLNAYEMRGAKLDYITISAALCFSGRTASTFAELRAQQFYNCIPSKKYDAAGYLDGLEIVSSDWQQLAAEIAAGKYGPAERVLYILDPPYMSVEPNNVYKESYFTLSQQLDVLKLLHEANYIYFSSNKSQIYELLQWLDANICPGYFGDFKLLTKTNIINKQACFEDFLIYCIKKDKLHLLL